MNWMFVLRACLTTIFVVAALTALGWWAGEKAFDEHVRKIRIRNQKEFFQDIQSGISDFRRPPTEDQLLIQEKREGKGLTVAKAFSMVYAFYGFWAGVALTGGNALLRLFLLSRPGAKAGEDVAEGTVEAGPSDTAPADPSGAGQASLSGTGQASPSAAVQADPSGTGQASPSAAVQADSSGTSQADPSGAGQADPSGSAQASPSGTAQADPSGTAQADPSGAGQAVAPAAATDSGNDLPEAVAESVSGTSPELPKLVADDAEAESTAQADSEVIDCSVPQSQVNRPN